MCDAGQNIDCRNRSNNLIGGSLSEIKKIFLFVLARISSTRVRIGLQMQ